MREPPRFAAPGSSSDPSLMTDPARYARPSGPAVLVAGATGTLGGHLVRELIALGHRVVALTRRADQVRPVPRLVDVVQGDLADAASLDRACAGVDVVFSCAGASLDPADLRDRASFDEVDWEGNRRLLESARRAGVKRFLYVSLFNGQTLLGTEYARAHERFAELLEGSGLRHTVVRPTGFFSAFEPFVRMARRGVVPVIGPGEARTNPIHEADLAELCAAAVARDDAVLEAGGPEVLTRRRIAELALEAAGRGGRVVHVPPAAFGAASALARPFNRRVAAVLDFGRAVSLADVVAPARGRRRLGEWFERRAAALAAEEP